MYRLRIWGRVCFCIKEEGRREIGWGKDELVRRTGGLVGVCWFFHECMRFVYTGN